MILEIISQLVWPHKFSWDQGRDLQAISWLTALFGAIFPFEDKTQIQKS